MSQREKNEHTQHRTFEMLFITGPVQTTAAASASAA
jgi:hypothetical protein